ncbi:Ceroid-lipofuscinosis neuronal protein 5 [Branchiostoma belcheri]|nr:Ceroid-lipofuscinosis neuronal protein 5 [Branchiostoma belcheri]
MSGVEKLVILLVAVVTVCAAVWPIPYRRFDSRPKTDAFCQALYPFCPTGHPDGSMPKMMDSDVVEVFSMKAPVWEFKFGDLLAHFDIIHDAIGFRNNRTGLNYTMEWYELFQLFNCTFGHVLTDMDPPLWCNQGAACLYDGIDDLHWSQNGSLVKVAEISGKVFNELADWVHTDNNTGIYYETWTVRNSTGPDSKLWFEAFDCASFVIRTFNKLGDLGAKFNTSVQTNYTKITLFSEQPVHLGNASTIFGPKGNKTLATEIRTFYEHFQAHQPFPSLLKSMLEAFDTIVLEKKWYFFYNFEYWFLPMKEPFIKLTYEEVPLPGRKEVTVA